MVYEIINLGGDRPVVLREMIDQIVQLAREDASHRASPHASRRRSHHLGRHRQGQPAASLAA
jgi:CMP-2-keto-3-deoxyoctulosonic acid synthetase